MHMIENIFTKEFAYECWSSTYNFDLKSAEHNILSNLNTYKVILISFASNKQA